MFKSATATATVLPFKRPGAHKELALAVIVQAIRDLDGSRNLREDAEFFFSSESVEEWCGVAGVDPDFVKDVVRKYREFGHGRNRNPSLH